MKKIFICILLAMAIFLFELFSHPRYKLVRLENIPETQTMTDVTFMFKTKMVPQPRSNPFYVIYSPLEKLTDKVHMVDGTLRRSDEDKYLFTFNWYAFGGVRKWKFHQKHYLIEPEPYVFFPSVSAMISALKSR